MDAVQEIRDAQRDWANSRGIPFDSKGYVREVGANLYQPLSRWARRGYGRGAGAELRGNMRALHSSSALVVNLFDYWTDRDKSPLLSALGVGPSGDVALDFEARFPTGLGGTPPHLDVSITRSASFVVAVEGKFTEHLGRATRGKSKFSESYFPRVGELWADRGLPACQELAGELWAEERRGGRQRFEYLDLRQLLKHALGLATQMGSGFRLLCLYYDWTGARREAHRGEVDVFSERVGDEIGFRVLTYQEVFEKLRDSGQVGPEYLDYLGTRYFARPGQGASLSGSFNR